MKLQKRLAGVLSGLACISLLASCTPHSDGTHPVTITDAGNASNLFDPPVQNATGWEVTTHEEVIPARILCRMSGAGNYFKTYNLKPEDTSSAPPVPGSTLVSLNPQDGSVRWARNITPEMRTNYVESYTGAKSTTPQDSFLDFQECAGSSFVSNERYLAFYLRPWMASEGSSNIGDQRMKIVVLDAETGNEVRTVEVSGLVLGQAIINDSLVVETAQNYYPAGTGILNVFSLTDPHAEPTTTRTDNWLIGSTKNSLLMSPQSSGKYSGFRGSGPYWVSTITRTTTSGEELDTFTGVTAIHPNGWIERAKDPKAAVTEAAANPKNALLTTLPRDLINIDSGTSLDITGQYVADVSLPTGPGLLLQTVTTTGEGKKEKTTFINHSWLPATPDSTEPHTNDIQQIGLENKANKVFSKTIHMGEEDN